MASAEVISNRAEQREEMPDLALLSTKRKRDESAEVERYTNGVSTSNITTTKSSSEAEKRFVRDLIDVLKSEDLSNAILSRPIFVNTKSPAEPQIKRQRSDGIDHAETTILSRYASEEYTSVDEVLRDIDATVANIKETSKLSSAESRDRRLAESDNLHNAATFKDRAHRLVTREKALRDHIKNSHISTNTTSTIADNKTVLTLYGNAPGPKQLFSSFQQATTVDQQRVNIQVQDAVLPNGITTTQIVPPQVSGVSAGDKSRVKNLGELFPSPSTLAVIQPPKPSKLATTRSNVVGWYQPAPKDPSPRAPGYLTQSIVAGQWLDYSKSNASQDSRRKTRDRAMSLTASKPSLADSEGNETEAAKLEALFRSAYSGFAPTKDHSAAIVSECHVNRIWWQKSGEKAYNRIVTDVINSSDPSSVDNDISETLEELDIAKLDEMADLDPDTIDPSLVLLGGSVTKSAEEKDTEEVLADISDLLETLNSYQRIRHMSLNSGRPGGILSTTDAASAGTPFRPSESEQLTYEMLKTSLKMMIETLPPYAVAKLDPDRLAELSIMTKIEIAPEEYKGVMEEDEASARARAALAAAASRTTAATPLHRSGSSSQMYGNQYSAQQTNSSQMYRPNAAHTPVRPPSNNYQRAPATISAPYQARPNPAQSQAYRPNYGTPSYPQQGSQSVRQPPMQYQSSVPYTSSSQQFQHTNNAPAYMRSQSQTQAYSQTPQGMPQQGINGNYGRPAYPQQGQPMPNGMNYQYNPNNVQRQDSPQNMYSPQPMPAQTRQYGTPTPTHSQGPSRPPSYLQSPLPQNQMNGPPTQSSQPAFQRQSSTGGGHMGYSTFMTSAEQSNLLERQRAQLAQQQGMQQQARSAAQAALGSPSPATTNGAYPVSTGQ